MATYMAGSLGVFITISGLCHLSHGLLRCWSVSHIRQIKNDQIQYVNRIDVGNHLKVKDTCTLKVKYVD